MEERQFRRLLREGRCAEAIAGAEQGVKNAGTGISLSAWYLRLLEAHLKAQNRDWLEARAAGTLRLGLALERPNFLRDAADIYRVGGFPEWARTYLTEALETEVEPAAQKELRRRIGELVTAQ